MGIKLFEHKSISIQFEDGIGNDVVNANVYKIDSTKQVLYGLLKSKPFNKSSHCFTIEKKEYGFELKADYCIGLDWLGDTGRQLYVEPKINTKSAKVFDAITDSEEVISVLDTNSNNIDDHILELDYLKMLLQITSVSESNSEIKELLKIDWHAKPIEIEQKDDKLTPFLVLRFLQTLKTIVRKGLKKNYYKVQENLNNRVKGKILVGQHIKQNVFKNKLTSTFCEYQQFGEDHSENRFLKRVLQFASSYVENNKNLFGENFDDILHSINYCRPAFESISNQFNDYELKHIKHNPFYKDYAEALQMGNYILKKFAYNITQTTTQKAATPPFWIDMPRLFELYVYSKMIEANTDYKEGIHYQFSTYGNALDILISKEDHQMVIDAKYKLQYQKGHLHDDIRQVAGYARLHTVREQLKIDKKNDKNIECLIIYPEVINGIDELTFENIKKYKKEIPAYHKVFKLGIKLPYIIPTEIIA